MKYINKILKYDSRQIHLGLVISCKNGDRYGLLYGEKKYLYFEKNTDAEITKNTIVSYLSYDFTKKDPKVDFVYPLSTLVKIKDKRGAERADGVYHDDETWRLINEGIPYVDFESGRNCCIYYPIINDNICTIWSGLLGCGIYVRGEQLIFEMFNELSSLKYTGWPTLEEVTNAINKFKEEIDSINAFDIIDTFRITKKCRYISRPGNDDNYYEDLYQHLPNDDKFLSYLLPTKQENVFFDGNAYRSDGYKDEDILLQEETARAKEKAKSEYSKEKHLAFLINGFFSSIVENKERAELLKSQIYEKFDVDNTCEIASQFNGQITEEFVNSIKEYNESKIKKRIEAQKS